MSSNPWITRCRPLTTDYGYNKAVWLQTLAYPEGVSKGTVVYDLPQAKFPGSLLVLNP